MKKSPRDLFKSHVKAMVKGNANAGAKDVKDEKPSDAEASENRSVRKGDESNLSKDKPKFTENPSVRSAMNGEKGNGVVQPSHRFSPLADIMPLNDAAVDRNSGSQFDKPEQDTNKPVVKPSSARNERQSSESAKQEDTTAIDSAKSRERAAMAAARAALRSPRRHPAPRTRRPQRPPSEAGPPPPPP